MHFHTFQKLKEGFCASITYVPWKQFTDWWGKTAAKQLVEEGKVGIIKDDETGMPMYKKQEVFEKNSSGKQQNIGVTGTAALNHKNLKKAIKGMNTFAGDGRKRFIGGQTYVKQEGETKKRKSGLLTFGSDSESDGDGSASSSCDSDGGVGGAGTGGTGDTSNGEESESEFSVQKKPARKRGRIVELNPENLATLDDAVKLAKVVEKVLKTTMEKVTVRSVMYGRMGSGGQKLQKTLEIEKKNMAAMQEKVEHLRLFKTKVRSKAAASSSSSKELTLKDAKAILTAALDLNQRITNSYLKIDEK